MTGTQSQEQFGKQAEAMKQYGVESQEVFEKEAERKLNGWFAFIGVFAVIAVIMRAPIGQGRMLWIHQRLHKLGIPGCVWLVTAMATGAHWCKDRLHRFWHKQHSRVQKLDTVPPMCHHVATVKQDLSDIKQDLLDIKGMLRAHPTFFNP